MDDLASLATLQGDEPASPLPGDAVSPVALQHKHREERQDFPAALLILVRRGEGRRRRNPDRKVCLMGVTKVAYPEAQDRGPVCLDIQGVRSLEVRWIFAGRRPAAMAAWIGRFPSQTLVLEDVYLVDPHLPGQSVKVREGRALEVKLYQGSAGLIEVPCCARGRLEAWQKWSFPCYPVGRGGADPAGWRTVRKRRQISRFSRAGASAVARAAGPGEKPECAVELAEFRSRGDDWWTLGFEATGPAALLSGQLEAAAALVFSRALPEEVELDMSDCMSYAQWLRR